MIKIININGERVLSLMRDPVVGEFYMYNYGGSWSRAIINRTPIPRDIYNNPRAVILMYLK